MKTLKSAAESIIRRCRGTGHRTKLIKRPAILILIAIMITTSVLSPSGLTLGSGGLSPVPVKAAGAEDGTSSGEADNAESSTGSAREETGNTDAGASESEGEKEDKDNTASDVKKGGNDAASQDQGGDTGIAEDAGKGDYEEKSGSANGSSDKKNNETKDAAADSDKSGKKGNEAAGAGSGEKNTSKDSGSGRKNSSDRDNVNENGTEGTTAPENDEIILTETARDKSYTITVRGDKYSGLKNVDKMTVLEITKDDQFYEEFVKKLNKTLNKTTEGQIQDIRLYDIEFTDQNGLPVHLKRNVDVTITYNNYKASPKVEMNQVVRAFIATTVTYYGFFTNVTTSFAKAYASGAGARVSRKGMTGNTAAADRQIKISKTEWIDEKEILTDISRNRVNEVTYILPKDGVTGIAVIGKDPEIRKPEQGQTEDKGETATEAQTADKIEAGKEAKPEDKSETATETQPEDKSEAATEAQPGDKSEAGKENQPEGENGDGQDSQTGTQKEENSEARTADQTQTSPETQTADQIQTGPEAQTGDQNEAGQETQPEKTLTVKGKDYRVTVTYDDKAGLPEGARLTAREIGDYSRSYKNYLSQAESALTKDKQVNTARFFDITIWDGAGNKIEPKAPVRVSIEFDSVDVQDKGNVELIHFEEDKKNAGAGSGKAQILHDVEVQDGEKKDTVDGVSFDIGGFSVFGVLQTVQVLKMTASDGKQYKVTVTYDDTCGIPADAKLIVNEISKTDKRYNDYVDKTAETLGKDAGQFSYAHALDIMLVGQVTGKHYQPTKDVKVSIELLKEDISEDQDVNVVHFQGDEKNTASRMDSKVDEGSVEFETDGFSVYVLIGSGGETVTPQCTYTFYVPDPDSPGQYKEYSFKDSQGHTVYNQTISSGEELIVPQITSADEKTFAGWYKGDTTGGTLTLEEEPYNFDNIIITENSAIDLYAVYKNYATVTFHDKYDSDSGSFPVAYTRRAELVTTGEGAEAVTNASVKIDDLSIANTSVSGKEMAFFGWSETPITTPGAAKDDKGNNVTAVVPDAEGCIQVTEAKDLYPIFIETHLITFYAAPSGQGAAYNGPRYVNKGDYLNELPTTSLSGYTFTGWFTGNKKEGVSNPKPGEDVDYGKQISDANGTLILGADDAGVYVSEGKLYMRADTTLYAKWKAKTTALYKIVYLKQLGTGDDYTYVESSNPRTGTVGDTVSVLEQDKANDRYEGFHLKEEPASAVIEADGSTVLKVYYDHNDGYTPSSGDYTLTFADSITAEGERSTNLPLDKTVAAGSSLTDQAIEAPVSVRKGYEFDRWYLDPDCTIAADLDTMRMPDNNLTLYAGWKAVRNYVFIDPNYGELAPLNENGVPTGTGSTWFTSRVDDELIAEYKYVTRNYVESSSGTFFYVNHDFAGYWKGNPPSGANRKTYYTTQITDATEDTTFEYAPGIYTYAGWYEVYLDENGNEIGEAKEPYDFSKHTDHTTKIRLHWKKNGVFYLAYDAGEGKLEDESNSAILSDGYADGAEVVLTRSANAPNGKTFIGWKVRGSDSNVIFKPGQIFTLHADDTKRISGKDVVYLDAVYARVETASVVYNANGGTVAENNVDFGKVPGSNVDEWNNASGTIDTVTGTATVSGLANNSKFKLSDGTGFIAPDGSGATFLGWSEKAICDDSATFFSKDSTDTYAVNAKEPVTLYAVWGVPVTYNLNSTDAGWGDEAWDTTVYTKNNETNTYSQTVNIGNAVSEPVNDPTYSGTDGKLFRYWATRTGSGTDADPYVFTEYDFSQPITGALDLYAYWGEANTITVHAVDASGEELSEIASGTDGWTISNVTVSTAEIDLPGSYVTGPSDYAFAFVAVASDLSSVSGLNAVTAIKYEDKKVKVRYAGESSFKVLGEGRALYFVYYQEKALNIGYKSMGASGVLENVTTTEGTPTTTGETLLGAYSMSEHVSNPLSYVIDFKNYAFAIGSTDPGGETQMNASNLSLITNAAGATDPIPTLRVRNTWRGFEYTTEAGDDAVWTSCGYNPQLYVIYYTQQPTVVLFGEETVGTGAVMGTAFTYDLLVTETTTTKVSVQRQTKVDDNWVDFGEPDVTTATGEPTTIFDTTAEGNQPYILKNCEANSSILFYSSTLHTNEAVAADENTRTVTTTTTVTAQTAKITQTANDAFTTAIDVDGTAYTESPTEYTYTATGSGGTVDVTFTNTHKSLPVEVHVAMVENDGSFGGIIQRDSTHRSSTETAYKFDLALGSSETLLTKLPSEAVFTGDADTYAFGAVVSGTGTESSAITVESMGVVSIGYEKINDNIYELVLKDNDGHTISELGSNQLYYLYYPLPKIRYVKEATDGKLTDITGCLINQTTGNIEASNSVTYSHQEITMNGKTVAQNQSFEIPLSGFVISQSGNNFRMPPVLDDDLYERYLGYVKIGAGTGTASNSSDLDVSTGLTMQLKVQNNTLQYSFDGTNWKDLPLSGIPTIYAIYSERGYDLQISKTVDMSQSGEDPLFSGTSFPMTISSMAITKNSYDAEGADSSAVTAIPAEGTTPGTITLTVVDGTKVRIKGLGRGKYTITESGNENYTLTAKTGPIVGSSTTPMIVADNTMVSFTLGSEKKVDLTNSPKAICKIDDHYFYTLRSMVAYVDENIATKTATAEMLTDYLMPAADTVEIPSDFNITLTTIEDPDVMDHPAVISRTADLAGVPLFASAGNLTLTNLTLEGSSVEATAPIIQSAGNLTIDSGATIQNCVGGGAVNATAGNITVSGTIQNCSAAEGGAIYHSGNGTITLNGTGAIQNNKATSGDGGAIWLGGGMVTVSGTSKITGNEAESGNGGAIFANSVVEIEIYQGGAIKTNTAKEGGAIYANETTTINIAETENASVKPAVTGNVATTGNGGAIYVNGGSVSVSGGSMSSNKAEEGQGGAVYSNNASITVSGTAEVKNNTAKEGGAVYTVSGPVTISGGSVDNNTASTGGGGAVYAGSGNVTVSGGSLSNNKAQTGGGGAVYSDSGNVAVSGGSLSNNTANTDGGAVFAGSGNITVSVPDGGTAPMIQSNMATTGRGGALYANTGVVSITGTTLSKNTAGSDGGAVYAGSGAVTLTNSIFGGDTASDSNTAAGNGGAIYAGSGNVTLSGGSMKNNTSTSGKGGALYLGSGMADVSSVTLSDNSAAKVLVSEAGKGGAIYLDSGSLTLTSFTATDNTASNGAAVFTNTGRVSFSDGCSITGNAALNGGAVGVGGIDARLVFSGTVGVKNNTLGTGEAETTCNVYLDQDDEAIINAASLNDASDVGIYVPDKYKGDPLSEYLFKNRGGIGGKFGMCASNASTLPGFRNDREENLSAVVDSITKRVYWSSKLKVEVRYLGSFSSELPTGSNGTKTYGNDNYYPAFSGGAVSLLADELWGKWTTKPTEMKAPVYAMAFLQGSVNVDSFLTKLFWKDGAWWYENRVGSQGKLDTKKVYIYYSEAAFLSIENNTSFLAELDSMTVNLAGQNRSLFNSSTLTGLGLIYAWNGSIQKELLPVQVNDDGKLVLSKNGGAITILVPGGQNASYTLDGVFSGGSGSVNLRLNGSEQPALNAAEAFHITGTTRNDAKTYEIIFGSDKIICKIVCPEPDGISEGDYVKKSETPDANGNTEYCFARMRDAVAFAGKYKLMDVAIEMLVDYLMPGTDTAVIADPTGHHFKSIKLKTAVTGEFQYPGSDEKRRATISRGVGNDSPLINVTGNVGSSGDNTETVLFIHDLDFDGKNLVGNCEGGAVATKDCKVDVKDAGFVNCNSYNGGATFISFGSTTDTSGTKKYKFASGYKSDNATLTVSNVIISNCQANTKYGRSGGGAIWTNAKTFTATNCQFLNCRSTGDDNMQGGAVFHRIEATNKLGNLSQTPYFDKSETIFTNCTFTGCVAQGSGGAMESDATDIKLDNCTFTNCSTTKKDGAGLNVYIFESDSNPLYNNTVPSKLYLNNCSFVGCTSGRNGGAVRSLAVDTEIVNCTFTNTSAIGQDAYGGGAVYVSNTSGETTIVSGCTFTGTSVTKNGSGGAIFTLAKKLTVENTTINNSQTPKNGGAVYNANKAANGFTTLTGCTITGCTAKQSGGGLYTNTKAVTVDDASVISDNTATSNGGGIAVNMEGATTLTIADSTVSRNIASNSNGGGVWLDANNDSNRNNLTLNVKGSSIDGNTSGGNGGGVYTLAKTVTIGASETRTDENGKAIRSSVSNNIAKTNGGGMYQNRNVDGASLIIACTNINGNTANNAKNDTNAGGGGIFAGVRTLTITDSDISNNTSKIHGGGVLFEINEDNARNAMCLTVEGCTLNGNTASGNGGGIYTKAKTVEIKAHTEGTGESAVVVRSEISNCTATWSGGGLYQNRDVDGSTLTVTNSVISGCRSNDTSADTNPPRGGGGIMANVSTVTVTGSEIKNNTAVRNGGGIDAPSNGTTRNLIIDNSKITGNSAGNQGGGVFTRSQLTLRNDTEITGNRLTTNNVENCAGVYLPNDRTVYVGPENAESGYSDTIIVRNNTTANNTLSDLRLWWNSSTSENNASSVYVYCNLSNESEIRVVNAAKAGTQFGSAAYALTNGFSDDNAVFKADSSTLYGITDRTDPTNKTIIWAGPPIAKLTDGNGRLLYIKYYEGTATYPAIFDRLDTGINAEGSIASPFSLLRMENLTLYYKDGTEYNGTDYCIKMLVEHYETSADMTLPYVEGRTVTFTTAEKNFPNDWLYDDLDTYHFEGRSGGRATVIRGKSVAGNRTLMNVNGTLNLENIVIDGGTENGVTVTNSTRCMYINEANCTVTIGENAVLQNGKVSGNYNGGGVLLNNGALHIDGGIIRNCTAGNDGGGVFLQQGSVTLTAGSIYQCTANGSGGGVRNKAGTFRMSGGTIQGCSAKNGGGVYLPGNNNYPMYMSGGSIINNSATSFGGGIAFFDANARLYLSGKVNISGNTSEASKATNKACNVELNQDFNGVINTTGDGLYPGAYIGVYVPDGTTLYDKHGVERKPFGNFKNQNSQTNTTNFYSFVNDRNGLKGGIIEKTDPNYVKTGDYADCCIYWIKIFSLEVTKEVVSGASTTVDPDEMFLFKVNVRGNATVAGQLNAAQIDSSTGDYGEMQFTSNGSETTTAIFGLVDGQTISGVNLSEGLTYEVTEYLTVDQAKRYAAMPMNGAGTTTESLEYNGVTYQVIRVNTFSSRIGENKERTDVDPYTSSLTFSNLMPVCKITDMSGNLLYRRYDWDKVTNKTGEGQDGGSSTNQPYYYAPAVFTELTGDNGAFKALEGTLYRSNGSNPISYSVSNGVQIQMLIGEYTLSSKVTADTSKVTLTTASASDTLFPKQDPGSTSTIRRAFGNGSMFDVSGDLTLATIILDGAKGAYTVNANGGIANVPSGGNLTIQNGATLQNSKTAEGYNGGAVYVASSGTVTMTGGTVNHNESVGNGAGIYLAEGSTLNLSGAPNFGGTGTNVSGNITATNGNFKTGALVAKLNGGKTYNQARQDIFIAGYEADNEETYATSLVVNGVLKDPDNKNNPIPTGSIWVWAEKTPHYKSLQQFAKLDNDLLKTENGKKVIDTSQITEEQLNKTLEAFRNARPDNDTGADQVGEYLYGFIKGDDTEHVYWYGVEGSRRVILRKVASGTYQSLQGAKFEISTSPGGSPAKDKEGKDLRDLTSGAGGAFYIGELNYGTYYVKETQVPAGYQDTSGKYFIITVSEDGVGYKKETDTGAEITREVTARTPN